MENIRFKAMVVEEASDGKYERSILEKTLADLPEGDVLVEVHYSSLNYKDALSAIGNKGVTKKYPHTPGIDAAGIVKESGADAFKAGEKVIVTSYDLGMNTAGGFGQYIRAPAGWVVKLPAGLTLAESMAFGTAGFTAGMSVDRLINHGVTPDQGDILVTGATGGVGSLAVAILAHIGFDVVGVTGKSDGEIFLKKLGAQSVISREEATDASGKPLLKTRWAGVIDTVGGEILSTAIRSAQNGAAVTCCGLVASHELPLTVFPFILRGIALYGIDSEKYPMPSRRRIWKKLASDWKIDSLEAMTRDIGLSDLEAEIDRTLNGKQMGRVRIDLRKS